MPGTLFVVATPIGNLEDITLRALRVLREAALIAAEDTRRTAHLLARHAITTATTSLHAHNESAKAASIVERLKAGQDVALVSDAGTPTVSDPGGALVRAAIDAGIRVEPVPGPSAVLAAVAVSGFQAGSFTFMGFAPLKPRERNRWFAQLLSMPGLGVFFESPHRIRATMDDLRRRAGDCEVAICRELTKLHENVVRGPISDVVNGLNVTRGEFTVVVKVPDSPLPQADAVDVTAEFGVLTKMPGYSKRRAIAEIARRFGLSTNDVYERLESAKNKAD